MKKSLLLILILLISLILISCKNDNADIDTSPTDTETAEITQADSKNESETDTEDESDIPLPPTEGNINPKFSHAGGLYNEDIDLKLSLDERLDSSKYEIRYTTDGSLPTKKSKKYTDGITISASSNSQVIRAICYSGTKIVGKVMTETYIFNRSTNSSLFVVSITADKKELDNIIENYNESIEIPSHTEIITPSGERVISQDTGLKIFGGSSREHAQKSFKVIARNTERLGNDIYIGKGSFSYPLFEDRKVISGKNAGQILEKYDSFILRNGGNDSLNATNADPTYPTLLRDNISNNFAKQVLTTFDYSLSQFAAVYLNGEYYGILDMRENMNEDYVKNVYGVDDDNVTIVKSELDTTRWCGDPSHNRNGSDCRFCGVWFYYETDKETLSDLTDWKNLCKSAINATSSNYNKTFKKIEGAIDLDSFAEYMALNMYLCNTDWPHNNVKIWRYNKSKIDGIEITDGKWRFMYRDMDFTMSRYESSILPEIYTMSDTDMFYRTLGNYIYGSNGELYSDSLYIQGLFNFCLKNKDFRNKFISISNKLCSDESKEILLDCYKKASSAISPEITKHIKRWQSTVHYSYTSKVWKNSTKRIEAFIKARPDYYKEHMQNAMKYYK